MEEIILYKNKKKTQLTIIYLTVFLIMETFCTIFAFVKGFQTFYKATLLIFTIIFLLAYLYNFYIFFSIPTKLLVGNDEEITIYFTKKKFRTIKYSKIKDIKYYDPKGRIPDKMIIKIKDNEFKMTEMINGFETYKKIKKLIHK